MDENNVLNPESLPADLVNVADIQHMVLYLDFADGAEATLPLTARQAALLIYVLGLTIVDDEIGVYSDEKLEEFFSARKKEQ